VTATGGAQDGATATGGAQDGATATGGAQDGACGAQDGSAGSAVRGRTPAWLRLGGLLTGG
jgi:hypothetical protein